ncbi:MAG: hypothetical protein WDN48_03455 [Pseudolabrys sp.]
MRPYSKEESSKLLEPWLGSGLSLDTLPVPRLIVVKIAPDTSPDIAQLRKTLAEQAPGATLDDHRGWIDRMRAMAGTAVRRRHRHSGSDDRGHRSVGHIRHARRDGHQQDCNRGAAFRRRKKTASSPAISSGIS